MEEQFANSIKDLERLRKFSDDEMKVLEASDRAADEIAEPEYEHYLKHEFNSEAPGILAKHNLLGIPIKKEYGGLEMPPIISALEKERLGQLGLGLSSFINVQVFLCAQTIQRWGTEEQKSEYLPKAVRKEKVFAFGLTEPEAGSDPASLKTQYKKEGDRYIINGTKYLISNGTIADYILVFARSAENPGTISAILVDAKSAGLSRMELREKIGLFTSDTGMLDFENVAAPKENMIGPEGRGMPVAYSALLNARLGVAAGCVGVIEASLNASLKRSRERVQHGKQIGKHQLIQQHISAMRQNLEMARWPTYFAAIRKGEYESNPNDKALMEEVELRVSLAKRIASRLAFESADRAVQVHGGFGYSLMSPVGQLFCDSRVARIYEGTDEIQDLKIASSILGEGFEAYS
ncbi:MAG: acyl-CoA dehydrogenase domain protein [Candidatus Micrarchaeum acidiphilum ARMAN-2]|jgi:alkylation response protein AidB-like acyl-CoA dehydrogenase|uniref:Acyl-CoA dehydrogenase domain protein n=1 Tax=Candidatus Micrarchaeum acidiphilum ARMAN-2 TaxID=425595 RepID=C7DHK6_MICA2|nr:MAG: acyl-CoA dehydrogenase domain protein [Candidatus Micrarchaeum acidiphilum ARMAN-2]